MIDLATVQLAVQRCFETSTGLPFVWENAERDALLKPYGVLSFGPSTAPERDDIYQVNKDDNVTFVIVGAREFTIGVQVYSRSHEPGESARSYLERARTMLRSQQQRDLLSAAGLVWFESHPIVDLDFVFQERHESRAAFDVVFRTLEVEYDSTSAPGYFTHVDLHDEVKAA